MQKSTNRFFHRGAMQKWAVSLVWFLWVGYPAALAAQSYKELTNRVHINTPNTTAAAVVRTLEQQTTYTFIYDPEYLGQCKLNGIKLENTTLGEVLHFLDVYAPVDITYTNNTIALRKGRQERVAGDEKGRVRGKVVDNKNEALPGVTIQALEGLGTVTNVDGTYELQLPPGTYTLTFSYIAYETRKVTEVVVKANGLTPLDILMKSSGSRLKEVTVTANYKRASVEGLYALQKNNAAITDGISAEQISRTPDKNIGEVLKRVSGLATIDNKYVVVRGLSERYNQAVLNGQIMPSTELNRKNFSFDVIPSNIVENVVVAKTITPDRSAEFGGGLVEVNTLDIPTTNFLNVTAGTSFNDKTTGKDFLSLKLEGKEYFGQVSDHRKLMGTLGWKSEADVHAKFNEVSKDANAFSNNWGLYKFKAPVSQNYQVSVGRVIPGKGKSQFGVVASANYRNTLATQDVRMSRDGFAGGVDDSEYASYKGQRYGFTTNLGGLLGLGYRNERNRLGFQSLYMRTLDQQLIVGTGTHTETGGIAFGYYDLTTLTDLWQNQLKGEHTLGNKGVKFKWFGSYIRLDRKKPDNHQNTTLFEKTDPSALNEFSIQNARSSGSAIGGLRWWTRALENNFTWDASVSVPLQFNAGQVAVNNTFKAGYGGWSKDRLFYVVNVGTTFENPGGYYYPLAKAFTKENNVGFIYSPFNDDFHRTATLHAMYGMIDTKVGNKLRLVWGVRAEYFNLNGVNATLDSLERWINQSRGGGGVDKYDFSDLRNREPNWNIFPSANLTYSLTPSMNLRMAYAKSIIRPDLREMSYFREYDFELGGIYQSELVRSTIAHHLDFRYEWYPGPGEILSFSLFYKKFNYPMEIYADEGSGGLFELRNNKNAKNYGLEVEVRKSLAFTKVPVLQNITLYGNFTALDARVTPMTINYNGNLDSTNPAKVTPVEAIGAEEKRPQSGASNYIVNAGVYYDIRPVSLSLVYNYVSNRMFRPDVVYRYSLFERPLESLDAQVAVRFLKQHAEVKLNVSNILNSFSVVYKNLYTNDPDVENGKKDPSTSQLLYHKGEDVINYEGRPGRTFSATFSYKF